jgi:antitoxin ChpS
MEVILRKYANSTVLALPAAVLRKLDLQAGQSMNLDSTPDGKITLVSKLRYSLAGLLAKCDPRAPPPADLALWNDARPVGQEVW